MIYERKKVEEEEERRLSAYGAKASQSRGRKIPEEKCRLRTEYQKDRDRIIHSSALRRLMHKTQVFIASEEEHFRTRLTHTMEVSQISRTISRALGLNEDLTEAIALGHDLGHTPYGHSGERFLREIHPGGFHHNVQSLRVVEVLEKTSSGRPLNLTEEVRDGILHHTGKQLPFTLEGQVVKISDRIAYINHDIDDALRAGVISFSDLPKDCIRILGTTHGARINTLVTDMVENSQDRPFIAMSREKLEAMDRLRAFMFENVYHAEAVINREEMEKIRNIIFSLYEYYLAHPEKLPPGLFCMIDQWGLHEVVKDHIASMTDRTALRAYEEITIPRFGFERG